MDLRRIAIKIQTNSYTSLDDLVKDLLLMVQNAKTFNEPGSQIYKVTTVVRMQEMGIYPLRDSLKGALSITQSSGFLLYYLAVAMELAADFKSQILEDRLSCDSRTTTVSLMKFVSND